MSLTFTGDRVAGGHGRVALGECVRALVAVLVASLLAREATRRVTIVPFVPACNTHVVQRAPTHTSYRREDTDKRKHVSCERFPLGSNKIVIKFLPFIHNKKVTM